MSKDQDDAMVVCDQCGARCGDFEFAEIRLTVKGQPAGTMSLCRRCFSQVMGIDHSESSKEELRSLLAQANEPPPGRFVWKPS